MSMCSYTHPGNKTTLSAFTGSHLESIIAQSLSSELHMIQSFFSFLSRRQTRFSNPPTMKWQLASLTICLSFAEGTEHFSNSLIPRPECPVLLIGPQCWEVLRYDWSENVGTFPLTATQLIYVKVGRISQIV